MHEALITAALIAAVVWLWRENLRAREVATRAGRRICAASDVQFLDQTVAFARMSLAWSARPPVVAGADPLATKGGERAKPGRSARVALVRIYRFDYSTDGADRAAGLVVVQGGAVVHAQLADLGTLH